MELSNGNQDDTDWFQCCSGAVSGAADNLIARLLSSRVEALFIRKREDTPPGGLQPLTGQKVISSPQLSVTHISGCFLCAFAPGLCAGVFVMGSRLPLHQLSSGEFASLPVRLTRFPVIRTWISEGI